MFKPIKPIIPIEPKEDEEIEIKETLDLDGFDNAQSLLERLLNEQSSGVNLSKAIIDKEYGRYNGDHDYNIIVFKRLRKRTSLEFEQALKNYKRKLNDYNIQMEVYPSLLEKYKQELAKEMAAIND